MKKEYFAPKMDVEEYEYGARLLVGSGEPTTCDADYCNEGSFNINEPVDHPRV